MASIRGNNLIEFYKFLNGDASLVETETFITTNVDLQYQLDQDTYLKLLELNYNDKYAGYLLRQLITEHIISEGEYETWKLQSLLTDFLMNPLNIHHYLEKLYHLYCGTYRDNQQRRYQYKFLANLGLNSMYWLDEGYSKDNLGGNSERVSKTTTDIYYQQLKPFAEEILKALNDKSIQIFNDGTYSITNELKAALETETIYELKHPDN